MSLPGKGGAAQCARLLSPHGAGSVTTDFSKVPEDIPLLHMVAWVLLPYQGSQGRPHDPSTLEKGPVYPLRLLGGAVSPPSDRAVCLQAQTPGQGHVLLCQAGFPDPGPQNMDVPQLRLQGRVVSSLRSQGRAAHLPLPKPQGSAMSL